MGCINSKKELIDINPNLYRVVNVDDEGNALWSGQLGITRSELTLYRKGKDPTTWPIKCLRRYGYDADLFTFESGRRCTTGEGIYAFRCRRAESLFQMLQSYIQLPIDDAQNPDLQPLSNNGQLVIPRNSISSQQTSQTPGSAYYIMNRPTSQNLSPSGTIHSNSNHTRSADTLASEGNYLDPTPSRPAQVSRFQTGIRLNSVSSGPMSPDPHSPGSPSSITDILEVTQLNPLPITNTGNLNLYQEFPLREHNNNSSNKKLSLDCPINLDCPPQEPAPSLSSSAPRNEFGIKNSKNDNELPLSLSPVSTKLPNSDSLENSHLMYMNVNIVMSESPVQKPTGCTDTPKIVQTPTTTGSIFGIPRMSSQYSIDANRLYENLEPGDIRPLTHRQPLSKLDIFSKVELKAGEKSEPSTPTSHRCVYIQLDLNQISSTVSNSANNSTTSNGAPAVRSNLPTIATSSTNHSPSNSAGTVSLLPPDSPKTGLWDYATIDFNKTVALSNSTTPSSELDSEGSRKTRHSSVATFGPPKHSNSVSD
ncbi:Fibroblast growth factor receptor substrate 2, partial [Pseudolycoriella hygida]